MLIPLGAGFITPPLVMMIVQVFVGGIPVLDALREVLTGQFRPGYNYFLITLIGMLPALALIVVAKYASNRIAPKRVYCVLTGGLVGYLTILILIHVAVIHPLYGGGKMSSTGALAYLFIPFHSVWAIAIGLLIGWLISFIPGIRRPPDPSRCPVCDDQLTEKTNSHCTRCGGAQQRSRRRCTCGRILPEHHDKPCPKCGRFRCPNCQYDIAHVDHDACPECGTSIVKVKPV